MAELHICKLLEKCLTGTTQSMWATQIHLCPQKKSKKNREEKQRKGTNSTSSQVSNSVVTNQSKKFNLPWLQSCVFPPQPALGPEILCLLIFITAACVHTSKHDQKYPLSSSTTLDLPTRHWSMLIVWILPSSPLAPAKRSSLESISKQDSTWWFQLPSLPC